MMGPESQVPVRFLLSTRRLPPRPFCPPPPPLVLEAKSVPRVPRIFAT